MRSYNERQDNGNDSGILSIVAGGIVIFLGVVLTVGFIWGCAAGVRVYGVWSQGKRGQAELAHAEANRKIKTLEAKAFEESSKHLAEAEIIRARGVAEANKIIGESLKNNESYLRYLWINGLQHTSNQVVYIPTEGNLPILEAGKR